MAKSRSIVLYSMVVLLVVIAPTVVSLSWYAVTKNPNLRPLAVTQQALHAYSAATGGSDGLEIVAQIAWAPGDSGGFSRDLLKKSITDSFAMRGMDVRVAFSPAKDRTLVSYRVGKSLIGPYPTSRASEGIRAAVEAYRMYPQDGE